MIMVLVLLFLHLFRSVPALPAASLNMVIVDKYYSSFLPSSRIAQGGDVNIAYGDFILLSIKAINPGAYLVFDTSRLQGFSYYGRLHLINGKVQPGQYTSFLFFLVKDTCFVDVYTARGNSKVALTSREVRLKPICFCDSTGQRLTTLIVRQPQRQIHFFAQKHRIFAHIGEFYFLIKQHGLTTLRMFSLHNTLATGREIIFHSDSIKASAFETKVVVQDNEFILGQDTFWTGISDTVLVNYAQMDTTACLEIKYATSDNFTHHRLYPCALCLLRYDAASDLLAASRQFQDSDYRIVLFDCYRPVSVQRRMWEQVHNINYVAPPSKKSSHNRGAAIDISLCDSAGNLLDMGTDFDFFGPQAGNDYQNLDPAQRANRRLLQSVLEEHNFRPIRTEWWHFYHLPSVHYRALDYKLPCSH